jgi:hypothetical protein
MTRGALSVHAGWRGSPPSVRLESWPLLEGGLGSWAVLLLLLAVPLAVALVTHDGMLTAVAVGLMLAAGWRFLVPATYLVDALGISEQMLWRQRRIPWRSVAGIDIGQHGVLVIPDVACCPRLRGLYLPWGTQREALLALFAYYLEVPSDRRQEAEFDMVVAAGSAPAVATAPKTVPPSPEGPPRQGEEHT